MVGSCNLRVLNLGNLNAFQKNRFGVQGAVALAAYLRLSLHNLTGVGGLVELRLDGIGARPAADILLLGMIQICWQRYINDCTLYVFINVYVLFQVFQKIVLFFEYLSVGMILELCLRAN